MWSSSVSEYTHQSSTYGVTHARPSVHKTVPSCYSRIMPRFSKPLVRKQVSTLFWKKAGLFLAPCDTLTHSKWPYSVVNAVFSLDPSVGCKFSRKNALVKSKTLRYLALPRVLYTVCMLGMRWCRGIVHALVRVKLQTNLYSLSHNFSFSLPTFGMSMTGTLWGLLLGWINPFSKHIFKYASSAGSRCTCVLYDCGAGTWSFKWL